MYVDVLIGGIGMTEGKSRTKLHENLCKQTRVHARKKLKIISNDDNG
jgi:hypothetical protein